VVSPNYFTTMFSKVLNRNINAKNCFEISIEDAPDVANEVSYNLTRVNAKLKVLSSRAKAQGYKSTQEEWEHFTNIRADLAALHQALLRRISAANRAEKNARITQEEKQTFADHFKQVVRNEANPVDYQRWVAQAKIRHEADLARQE
jgi:hypothetical protein